MRKLAAALFLVLVAAPAYAQTPGLGDLLPQAEPTTSGRIIQAIIVLTVLSIAPGLLVTATCFTRFVIALSFLRSGLGLQSTPPNIVIISLALFMTYFAMATEVDQAWRNGLQPLLASEITEEVAIERIVEPFRNFMTQQVSPRDVALFQRLSIEEPEQDGGAEQTPDPADPQTASPELLPLQVLLPAYMVSELRRAFEIGFLILLPFLVIDLLVSVITMAMGMMMLPPTVLSLPLKILFFVLIDGWGLIVGNLLDSVL